MVAICQSYVDEGAEAYERRYKEQRVKGHEARAKKLGFKLVTARPLSQASLLFAFEKRELQSRMPGG